jgi:hemolysin activation/secretion protein
VFDAYASSSDVDGGSTTTAVGDLSFNGRGRLAGVRATRLLPRWGEVDQRVVVGVDQRDYLNQCAITGLPDGACGPAGESVTVQPLSLEYVARSGGDLAWGLGIGVHHNLRWGGSRTSDADFEAVRPGAKARYTALRVSASAATAVFEDWQLQARAVMQWSGDAMVPAEQFGIGGAGTVRGYEERELTGDRGGFVSLELTTPALGGDTVPGLQLSVFADAGKVVTLDGAQCLAGRSGCELASVGVGARAGTPQTQLRLHVGAPLRDGARTQKNKARVHAAFSHQF